MYDYDVGPGWSEIVKPLINFVESNGGRIISVTEKFGALRFNYEEPENYEEKVWNDFEKLVYQAENKSMEVCEYTGEPGTIRNVNGWFKCVSDEKYKELTSSNFSH
mgnify:CR=1 FL=1